MNYFVIVYYNENGQIINSVKFYRECIIFCIGIRTFSVMPKFSVLMTFSAIP